ncbi:MAG: hypothetical protein K1X67_13820 [Fimbriimonadaceae bacterium]|nr:hypothetical protein [Fimbriimonadaceae bacterium]
MFDLLRNEFRQDSYTGLQDPGKYKLVVIDGASTSPAELETAPLVKNALSKGTSVIILNAIDAHKQATTKSKCVPGSIRGLSAAYLITPLGGGNRVHLTNLRPQRLTFKTKRHEHSPSGFLVGQASQGDKQVPIDGVLLDTFMGNLHDRLAEQTRDVSGTPTPPSDYASSNWFQTSVTESWSTGADSAIDGQSIGHNITYTFYGYYDNGSTLDSHAFQWIAANFNGTVSTSTPVHNDEDHRGWIHTLFSAYLDPLDSSTGAGLDLALVNAQPTGAVDTLNSSVEFNIGYKGANGNTAWLWQQSANQNPNDFSNWAGSAPPPVQGNINDVTIQLMQTSPYYGDGSNWTDAFYTVFQGKHMHDYNPVSGGNMNVLGQAVWRTQIISNDTIQVACFSFSNLDYLYVKNDIFEYHEHYNTIAFGGEPFIVDLDMSSISGGNP